MNKKPNPQSLRDAQELINNVSQEYKASERALYGFAAAFAIVGLFALVWATINHTPMLAAAAGTLTALRLGGWIKLAREAGREGIAVRLLGVILVRPEMAEPVARTLHLIFREQPVKPSVPEPTPSITQPFTDAFGGGWEARHNFEIWRSAPDGTSRGSAPPPSDSA